MSQPYKNLAETAEPIASVLADRWSPRSFDPGYDITDEQLTALLEAARWAPSGGNRQNRRFIVTRRGSDAFDAIVASGSGRNKQWTPRSSVLIVGLALSEEPDGQGFAYATYDLSQSIAHLSVEAVDRGLVARQFAGFDKAAVAEHFKLAPDLHPVIAVAVGKAGERTELPEETAELEKETRDRLPLTELVVPVN